MATENEVPAGRGTKSLGDASAGPPTSTAPKSLPVSQGGIDNNQAAAAAGAAGAASAAQKGTAAASVGANAARTAVDKSVSGNGQSGARNMAGRYAGAAAAGGVSGAQQGAAAAGVGAVPGAAAGAAKEVGMELAKDTVGDVTKGGNSKILRGAAVGAPVAAAPPAAVMITLMAIYQYLKSLFFMMLAAFANLGKLLWQLFVGAVKAVGKLLLSPFMAVGGFMAKSAGALFGVGAAATPAFALGTGVFAAFSVAALVGNLITGLGGQETARDDGLLGGPCVVNAAAQQPGAGTAVPISESVELNAKRVYSVFKTWGMSDENIAGILGNWSRESGVDPTSVESIFTEPYRIGPRKQAAWDGNFTHIPGQEHGGIGLGQWSNGRTPMLLDYAEAKGIQWYTIEAQLAFMVQGDNPSDAAVIRGMITTSQGSPSAAAHYFHDNWERSADTAAMRAQRAAVAEQWFSRMSGWQVDPEVAGAVEDITGDLTSGSVVPISGSSAITDPCGNAADAKFAGLTDGGLTEADAQKLVDLYNQEGDSFLRAKYNGGGPGQCNGNYVQNCVSFSTYWYNKYTTFDQYAPGNGIATARSLASMIPGKEVTKTPVAYSVFSGPGSGSAGHTGVVLRVEGDRILVGEAGYCSFEGRVRWIDKAGWAQYEFIDMSDMLKGGGSPV